MQTVQRRLQPPIGWSLLSRSCVCFGFQSVRSVADEIIRGGILEAKTPERKKGPTSATYLHALRPRENCAISQNIVRIAEVDVEPPPPATISKLKVDVGAVHNHIPTWQGQKNQTDIGGNFLNINEATTH